MRDEAVCIFCVLFGYGLARDVFFFCLGAACQPTKNDHQHTKNTARHHTMDAAQLAAAVKNLTTEQVCALCSGKSGRRWQAVVTEFKDSGVDGDVLSGFVQSVDTLHGYLCHELGLGVPKTIARQLRTILERYAAGRGGPEAAAAAAGGGAASPPLARYDEAAATAVAVVDGSGSGGGVGSGGGRPTGPVRLQFDEVSAFERRSHVSFPSHSSLTSRHAA